MKCSAKNRLGIPCTRNVGCRANGSFCFQHDPEAIKNRHARIERKWGGMWDAKIRMAQFEREAMDAIVEIAAGHPHPQKLAQEIIDRRDAVFGAATSEKIALRTVK